MRRLEGRVTGERDKRWRRRMARWALANLGGWNTTYLKPSQHCLRGVILGMVVVGFGSF